MDQIELMENYLRDNPKIHRRQLWHVPLILDENIAILVGNTLKIFLNSRLKNGFKLFAKDIEICANKAMVLYLPFGNFM